MSNKTTIGGLTERLLDLCRDKKNAFVASIHGEWGVGKTFFWKEYIQNELEKEKIKVAYISLFGKDSLPEIKAEIALQIFARNKVLYNKKFKSIISLIQKFSGGHSSSLPLLLNLLKKEDFKDIIVCLDDFERHSEKIRIKDIMGFISELKEQKNCKIIMILNKDKIKNEDSDIYNEKIIDYEFKYAPNVEENYEIIKDKLTHFKEYPLQYFKDKDISNIRIMDRIINVLNDFKFAEETINNHYKNINKEIAENINKEIAENIKKEIAENIMGLTAVYAQYNFIDFENLRGRDYAQKINRLLNQVMNKNIEEKSDYENFERYLRLIPIDKYQMTFDSTGITGIVIDYLKSFMPDEEKLNKNIEEKFKASNLMALKEKVKELLIRWQCDFNYGKNDFVDEIIALFNENKDNIVKVIDFNDFIYYMELIKRLDSNSNRYNKFHASAVEWMGSYLPDFLERLNQQTLNLLSNDVLMRIKNFDAKLEEIINSFIKKNQKNIIVDEDRIVDIMEKYVQNNGSMNPEDMNALSSVNAEDFKEYILKDYKFVTATHYFIQFTKNILNAHAYLDTDVIQIIENISEAYRLIYKSGTENQKDKAVEFLRDFEKMVIETAAD